MAKGLPLMKKGLLTAELVDNDDVKKFLKTLPEGYKRRFLISILRQNSKPFIKSARQNLSASVEGQSTGYLAKSIGFKVKRTKNKDVVFAGVRPNANKKYSKQKIGNEEVRTASYAVGIEWGMYKGVFSGFGYMRKAYESQKALVRKNMVKDAQEVIEKRTKRMLKNGKYKR